MRYVLDSNVILFYIRDSKTKKFIEETFSPFQAENTAIISIVTVAEIMSMAKQQNWGENKLKVVERLFDSLVIVEIRYADLIEAYAQIDAFSQNKLANRKAKTTSRNMGKNDLWIAATTLVTNSKLITSDKDFNHLDGDFFDVLFFEQQK
jgi:predicted nucleic acid-binding protein